ncbi:response regulator [Phenylobacterium sp.]|uniref:response regulator n=1 Tax=Phenylobacterium sp. TaxID=1871053 RepID=UPI002E30E823|nr:response regulator [Phenylobacterium sp.]HEX2561702.1 response regulator [Phenylobacterium sp.]
MSLPEFFIERITDEVRLQMDGVLALAQRLTRQPLGGDAQTCVAGITEAAETVRRVLESSIELKAATNQDLPFSPEPTLLREVMDQVQQRWETRAAENGVTLSVSYHGHPEAMALLDASRLMQVFDGFIAQAVAGTRRGGIEASLKAETDGEGLRLEGRVRDSGDRSSIQDKYDIREIEARFGLETALGVALGHRIVKSLGGKIEVEPNAGAGETVMFELKAAAAVAQPEIPEEAPASRAAHILIVDDNATNRMVAETLCEMFDCTAETAEDGLEAVEAARTGRFDLILMDIKMPRMDGVAASKAIRALPGRLGRVPIIALTANADPEDAAGYLKAGMNGVVEKPMKPDNLLQALQAALGENPAAAA